MVGWVPYYYSAVVCCLSLTLLLLLLFCFCLCLSMFPCACWCARSLGGHGARSPARDAAHRHQHCCAIVEDLACSEFNLHLVAYCSWVERWDDGGKSCAAAAVLVDCVCFHRGHPKPCFIARQCSRILRTINKILRGMYLVKKSSQVHIFSKAIYDAGCYIRNKALSWLRWVIIWAKSTYIT